MKAVVQRVKEGRVSVEGEVVGSIGKGLGVFLGVGPDDTSQDVAWLARKIALLRVFSDDRGKMSRNVQEVGGNILVISQFTLYGDCRQGNRPDFTQAAPPEKAEELYNEFLIALEKELGKRPERGTFRAKMEIVLVNCGPVTLIIDSKK
jgi:D-tyrosyl-tRNA(Tyr) deacylase